MNMFKKLCLCFLVALSVSTSAQEVERALYIKPQFKFGKHVNGNGFMEVQYAKIRYDFSKKYTISGAVSTGFTSPRASQSDYNHALNRIGMKFTYKPFDELGFFFETSFTDEISGNYDEASYFVYDDYQAIGFSWDIRTYKFK